MENTTSRAESSGKMLDEDACVSSVRKLGGQQVLRQYVPRCPSPYGEPLYPGSLCQKKKSGRRPGELVQQNAYQEAEDKYSCLDLFPIDFLNYIRKR